MSVRTLILACATLVGMCVITTGNRADQKQAICKTVWLFGLQCAEVNSAIVSQIKAMDSFTLETVTPAVIQANHTAKYGQVQSVNFTMTAISAGLGCQVAGSSVSSFWYTWIDNGTNYCNLHGIMQGSGLTEAPGFKEYTNKWICSGYKYSSCKVKL